MSVEFDGRKICGHDVKFTIMPEQRKVQAVIHNCEYDAVSYIQSCSGFTVDGLKYHMKSMYWATATCAPEDEFNPELGKRIAYKRLVKKYLRYRNNRLFAFLGELSDVQIKISRRFYNAYKHIDRIDPLVGVNISKE